MIVSVLLYRVEFGGGRCLGCARNLCYVEREGAVVIAESPLCPFLLLLLLFFSSIYYVSSIEHWRTVML